MGFTVEWCEKEMRHVGRSSLHPLQHHYADSAEDAMTGIIALVEGLDMDNDPTDVDMPIGLADTIDVTNVCWPPFEKLL